VEEINHLVVPKQTIVVVQKVLTAQTVTAKQINLAAKMLVETAMAKKVIAGNLVC